MNFRRGVMPRMALLKQPFENRQLDVEVRRMDPFSLGIRRVGPEPLAGTLIRALDVLARRTADAA